MKKITLLVLFLTAFTSLKAEEVVGTYLNSYFKKAFTIEASLDSKTGKLDRIYIEVLAEDAPKAFISLKASNLEAFKLALMLIRDKHLSWVKIAKDNNVTEMNKQFGISFPLVNVVWKGSKWRFSFNRNLDMKFLILSDGDMIASCVQKCTDSSNEYIDETIYWVFKTAEDFNNLIDNLNADEIVKKLQSIKNTEDLFQ